MTQRTYKYDVPNLDNMTPSQMREFGESIINNLENKALELFPDKPFHYLNVTTRLLDYVAHKSEAIRLRLTGNKAGAAQHDLCCQYLFECLPTYARWQCV